MPPKACPAGYSKVLVSTNYTDFAFDDIFTANFYNKYPERQGFLNDKNRIDREYISTKRKYRSDPDIVSLFEEMYCCEIKDENYEHIAILPVRNELIPYVFIHEYDGNEKIEINYNKLKSDICCCLVDALENNKPTDEYVASYKNIENLRKDDVLWEHDKRYDESGWDHDSKMHLGGVNFNDLDWS